MKLRASLAAIALLATACQSPAQAAESVVKAPAATVKASESGSRATAIFAGGCFWGIEGIFSHTKGVISAVSGYHGGNKATAKYSLVSAGGTDHAEAVKVVYDPAVVRYDQLLRIFFSVGADPTTLNYQGPDRGTHYRSALIPMNAEQRKVARAYLDQLGKSGLWSKPIVTRIESYKAFYEAEEYHQDYMLKNPNQGYIVRWDRPKVEGLKQLYPGLYRATFKTG
ncbi:MAG TPA: peptide-methionine (S)-S-oxide reductase MsrA [Sphingomonadaceae bacterium]|nr:peptide-methionine (S)-S-oxide reductase MsrA [Sphingomonadaceae bacterium]